MRLRETTVRYASALVSLVGVSIYEVFTFFNFTSYLERSASSMSGGNYEVFTFQQIWINPLVRVPNEIWGIPAIFFEDPFLFVLLESPSDKNLGFFLYSLVEIVALDFLLGALLWLLLLAALTRVVAKKFFRHDLPAAS